MANRELFSIIVQNIFVFSACRFVHSVCQFVGILFYHTAKGSTFALRNDKKDTDMKNIIIAVVLVSAMTLTASAQHKTEVKSEFIGQSNMLDGDGNKVGEGWFEKLTVSYTVPMKVHLDSLMRPIMWLSNIQGNYAWLNNKNGAEQFAPDRIMSVSYSVTHFRPLRGKWSIAASLGLGLYGKPEHLSGHSLMASGLLSFYYQFNPRLSLSFGGALTTSYGSPLFIPLMGIDYKNQRGLQVFMGMTNGYEIYAQQQVTPWLKVRLTGMRADGLPGDVRTDVGHRVYSSTAMKSNLAPIFRLGKRGELNVAAELVYSRNCNITEYSYKAFWKNMTTNFDKKHFRPTWGVSAIYTHNF